jgi:hypothetical protein
MEKKGQRDKSNDMAVARRRREEWKRGFERVLEGLPARRVTPTFPPSPLHARLLVANFITAISKHSLRHCLINCNNIAASIRALRPSCIQIPTAALTQ